MILVGLFVAFNKNNKTKVIFIIIANNIII